VEKKFDIHQAITDKIAAQIEAGAANNFVMPWHRTGSLHRPRNVASKKHYRGINVLSLWIDADAKGFRSDTWATFKQWQGVGAQVRKGEKASLVVVYKDVTRKAKGPDDSDETYFLARGAYVFNAEQVDGWADAPPPPEDHGSIVRIARAEAFVAATGAKIKHGGERACYRPAFDEIQMPDERLFRDTASNRTENYYSVLFHELTHWSGADKRLKRLAGGSFGNAAYALEELVAELGAAYLCASRGISSEPRQDHASYINSWLAALKNDRKAIFKAASAASAAADYLEQLAEKNGATAAPIVTAAKPPPVPVPVIVEAKPEPIAVPPPVIAEPTRAPRKGRRADPFTADLFG
jgi:antirestriction protein ArdC